MKPETPRCGIPRRSDDVKGPGRKGKPCGQVAGWGTDHLGTGPCRKHGGSLPPSRKHGAAVLADMALRRELAAFAIPLDGDISPEQTLLAMVREAAGNVAYLGARVNELSTKNDETEGPENETEESVTEMLTNAGKWRRLTGYSKGAGLFGPDIAVDKEGDEHVIGEKERGMVKLYGEWADRLVKYSKTALDAGIAKAQVELAKQQGQTIVVIVNKVLVQMGLDEAKLTVARQLIAEEFRIQAQTSKSEVLDPK